MKPIPKPAEKATFPISYEAERAVLSALLTCKEAIPEILSTVMPQDFNRSDHQAIFQIVASLFEQGEPVDMVTVSTEYKKRGEFSFQVADLFNDHFSGDYQSHVRTVKDLSRRRNILLAMQSASELIAGVSNTDEVVSNLIVQLSTTNGAAKRPVLLDKVVILSQKRIELAIERKTNVTGIPTGFRKFDQELGGIQPGELMVIGARPAIGKSSLLAGIVLGAAKQGYPGMIVNAEMELVEVGTRMLAQASKIANTDLRRGFLQDRDFSRITAAAGKLSSLPVWIYDDIRWEVIKTQIKALKMHRPDLAIIAIDYVQRIKVEREHGEKRYEIIGKVAREAKDLAKELRVGVILAAQLNRLVEKEAREPQLSDFREAGDLEAEADVAAFLHCYKPKTEPWSVYLLIKKNRNGPLAAIHLKFVGNDVAFYGWED